MVERYLQTKISENVNIFPSKNVIMLFGITTALWSRPIKVNHDTHQTPQQGHVHAQAHAHRRSRPLPLLTRLGLTEQRRPVVGWTGAEISRGRG